MAHRRSRRSTLLAGMGAAALAGEAALIRLGLSYGTTPAERAAVLPGDRIVADPTVETNQGHLTSCS